MFVCVVYVDMIFSNCSGYNVPLQASLFVRIAPFLAYNRIKEMLLSSLLAERFGTPDCVIIGLLSSRFVFKKKINFNTYIAQNSLCI